MKRILPFITIVVFLLTACASAANAPEPLASANYFGGGAPAAPAADFLDLPAEQEMSAPLPSTAGYAEGGGGPGVNASQVDRMVIQNADLAIVVRDVEARMKEIGDMAEEMGGFVVSSNLYQSYTSSYIEVPEGQIVVRVPAEELEEALKLIKADVVEVQSETRSGQDVTAEYVDLQSRLKAKLAAEEQLTEIMQEARQTEDVLAVYAQLQQIQSEIEVLRGQIKYTEQSAALSSISVTIIAEETVEPLEVGGWKPEGVARDAIQSLIYFWQDFVDFMIRFGLYTLPVLITLLIPLFLLFLLVRWIVRKLRKPKSPGAPAETPKKK